MLSLENLRCFVAATQSASFRAGAKLVHLTPAAFGQRIRQLEDQIGRPLFERTTRAVTLTAAGLALMPRAEELLERAAECVRAVSAERALPPMELTIGTRYELGLSFLTPLLPTLEEIRSGMTLHLYFSSGPDLLSRIRARQLDCAVTSARLTEPQLESIRLHREEYVFVGEARLLERLPLKREADALHHTLIDIGSELPLFRYWRDAPGGGDRLKFGGYRWVGAAGAIRELVLAGAGIAALPHYMVAGDLRTGRLKTIFPSVKPLFDYFRLVFRADDARRPLYEVLSREILKHSLE